MSEKEILVWFPRLKALFPEGINTSYIGSAKSRYEVWILFNLIEILKPSEAYHIDFELNPTSMKFNEKKTLSLNLGTGSVAEAKNLHDALISVVPAIVLRFSDGSALSIFYQSYVPQRFQSHLGGIRPNIFLVKGEPTLNFMEDGRILREEDGSVHKELLEVWFGNNIYMIVDEVRSKEDSSVVKYGLHSGDQNFPVYALIECKESEAAYQGRRGAALQDYLLINCKKLILFTMVQPPALIPARYKVVLDRSLGSEKSMMQNQLKDILVS